MNDARVLSAGIDVAGNRVDVLRHTATPAEQRRLDAAYGVGAVHRHGFLEPA